jgi:hypothetical protein
MRRGGSELGFVRGRGWLSGERGRERRRRELSLDAEGTQVGILVGEGDGRCVSL